MTRPIVMLGTLLLLAGSLFGVTINFNDGVNGGAILGFYAAQGVTFSNGTWDDFVSPNEAAVGAGGLKLIATVGTFEPKSANPIVATFSSAITSLSIRGLNIGANGARIEAFDAPVGGNLVDFDQAFGIGLGVDNHPLLSVTGASIRRLTLFQPLSVTTEGLLFDNLEFTAVVIPEPGTYALMLSAGVALLAFRRKLGRS